MTVEAVKDIGATIDGGDIDQGLLISVSAKATEQRMAAMSALIEPSLPRWRILLVLSDRDEREYGWFGAQGCPHRIRSIIGGANELSREFRDRLY